MDYLYDRESGLPMLVDDETSAYLHDGGVLATIDGNDDALYLVDDALGSVRGVTDEAGDLDGTADYNVYGEVRASSGVSTLFRFTGEQHDAETGFTYLRARYANAALGRFTSADTVQPNAPGTQGYNLYAYVAGNPTTWVDPSGHSTAPAEVMIFRPLVAIQMMNPAFVPSLYAWCKTQASPWCVIALSGVSLGVAACILYEDCREGAAFDADVINRFGSLAPSDTDWIDWDKLKDAANGWPELVFDPVESIFNSSVDWCIWLYTLCDDQNWEGDCDDCLHYCRAQQGRWPVKRCHPQDWSDTGPSLARTSFSFLMSTTYPLKFSYPQTVRHLSSCRKGGKM
jgi:RHS repeat-associated protein